MSGRLRSRLGKQGCKRKRVYHRVDKEKTVYDGCMRHLVYIILAYI